DNTTMSVYPNPATSNVNININNISGTAGFAIRDMTGRTVFAQQIAAGNAIINLQVSDYARGMYFVSLRYADGSTLTQKLLLR
ncbi:MAG: T9SS type A sorting domain-containing protein, partial [Flavipsychrobacter sp.]